MKKWTRHVIVLTLQEILEVLIFQNIHLVQSKFCPLDQGLGVILSLEDHMGIKEKWLFSSSGLQINA